MKVKIYTLSTCPHCKEAKEFLKENNVDFQEIDVAEDKEAQKMLADKNYTSVPVFDIDGDFFTGFDEDKLKEKLGIK